MSDTEDRFFDAPSDSDVSFNTIHKPNINFGSRLVLPETMYCREQFSVWSFLKQCIGKELSKITMPLQLNEPLSFLQRISEYLEYSNLLLKAINESDHVKRMEYVAAFSVSGTASNWDRLGKPFNPLLGETFEYHNDNFVFVAEQVSHHPPVSAFYAEGKGFRYYGSVYPKLNFWGKSVQVSPIGIVTLELLNHKETYTWSNIDCYVHNVIVGKLWVEHKGKVTIHCDNGLSCELTFHAASWFQKSLSQFVDGYIFSAKGDKLRALYGRWTEIMYSLSPTYYKSNFSSSDNLKNLVKKSDESESISALPDFSNNVDEDFIPPQLAVGNFNWNFPDQSVLWQATPRPASSSSHYNFTDFAIKLNELTADLLEVDILPPTDCRYRGDIRLMERGLIDEAAKEKDRLENKQRQARNNCAQGNVSTSSVSFSKLPIWFKSGVNHQPKKNIHDWIFNRDYFKRDWRQCFEIY